MASVDPYQLLKALSILLNKDGSVKGSTELSKILNLMKAARKLVSRCIYVNILRATSEKTILNKFVDAGGWEILNIWLQEAKDNENHPFILELIKLFKVLPVSVEILKKTNTAKIIKQFSKGDTNDRLKACSTELVDSWMTVIRGSGPVVEKPAASKKKKLKKAVIEKADSPKEKKEDEMGDKEVDKKVVDDKKTLEESKDNVIDKRTPEEKEVDSKTAIKTEEKEEIVNSGGRTSPSEDDKKPPSQEDGKTEPAVKDAKNSQENNKKLDAKKENEKEGEKEKRPSRAKTRSGPAFAKFRSTGLESDAKLPPVKIKKKGDKITPKPEVKSTPAGKREGPLLSKTLTPPEKRIKKEDKIEERRTSTGIRVKIIPPKPRLQESSGFLEALNAPVAPVRKKVKKLTKAAAKEQSANSKGRPDGTKSDKSPSSTPEDNKTDPPKFNFYSNAEPEEGKDDNSVFGEVVPAGNEDKMDDKDDDKTKTQGKSNLKILPSRKKKTVTWKEDGDLVDVCFFELDENERENVNRPKDFRDAAQNEMRNERQTIANAMKANRNGEEEGGNGGKTTYETIPWRRPPRLDIDPLVVYGSSSTEKDVQAKRERTVLQEIFFSAAMIPDTPKEPDMEAVEYVVPKTIPLEDETVPEPMETQPILPNPGFPVPGRGIPPGGLPPRIANVVHQMPRQAGAVHPGGGGRQEPSMDKIKEILSSVMSNPNQPDVDIHSEDFTNKLREIIAPFKGDDVHEGAGQAPLLQTPVQGPPPLLEPLPPRGPPPHPYTYDPAGEPYLDPMGGQYPEYDEFGGMPPPPEMGMEEGHYPGFEGPGFDYPYPEERFPNRDFRFRGPRPPGPRFRGRGGGGRGRGASIAKVCYHFTSERGCRLGKHCHFIHPGVTGPPPRR
ncbi:serine/threonine-protein phosphatase 1 regulatory subunit 10-like [Apostichopus japonicus]|uniref:serine/threonine-protein phosphatase 1 regulatory subunit 10-like n=1 Tax=Stichopus japonicus TaxID=307972 RepID=UPI003AB6DA47